MTTAFEQSPVQQCFQALDLLAHRTEHQMPARGDSPQGAEFARQVERAQKVDIELPVR